MRIQALRSFAVITILVGVALTAASSAAGQTASDDARQGPYEKLAIINAMIIPGHGGPAYGPADIVIEDGTIHQII